MRRMLYAILRIMNDLNAIKRGKVGQRIYNKAYGRLMGRGFRRK